MDALEFVMGCLQLPKPAKSFDVMLLTREMRTELQAQRSQLQGIHSLCGSLLQSQKEATGKTLEQGCMEQQYSSSSFR